MNSTKLKIVQNSAFGVVIKVVFPLANYKEYNSIEKEYLFTGLLFWITPSKYSHVAKNFVEIESRLLDLKVQCSIH